MKKLFFLTTALALVLGLSQCKKTRPDMPQYSGPVGDMYVQQATLKASQHESNSKVADDGLGCVEWEKGDVIKVSGGGTGTLTCTDADGKEGIFTGKITKTSEEDLIFTYGDLSNFNEQDGSLTKALHLVGTSEFISSPSGEYDVDMSIDYAVLKLDLSAFGTVEDATVTISAGGSTVASVEGVKTTSTAVYVAMPTENLSTEEDPTEVIYTFTNGSESVDKAWKIKKNTFYTKSGSSTGEAIVVKPIYIPGDFTISGGGDGKKGNADDKKVNFAIGNLWAETTNPTNPVFHLETKQWDYRTWAGYQCYISGTTATTITPTNHCGLFKWGSETEAIADNADYPTGGDLFAASNFPVEGEKWFTLSFDEWCYLLGYDPDDWYSTTYGRANALNLRGWVELTDVGVTGLVILPDDSKVAPSDITTTALLASYGAVFLPAAGARWYYTSMEAVGVGETGYYWSGTSDEDSQYYNYFDYYGVGVYGDFDNGGNSIRLVKEAK